MGNSNWKKPSHNLSSNSKKQNFSQQQVAINSLLDVMEDGREYESLLRFSNFNIDAVTEFRKSLKEIESIRKRPVVCYLANNINPNIKTETAIDYNDDLPFSEMIGLIPNSVRDIDIILVTPGGSAEQIARFVDRLRPRFENVGFILPDVAMSAGTIFVASGDEIIMTSRACIGPIDPQVRNSAGNYVPAQALLTLISEIQERGQNLLNQGQNPLWTDMQILNNIDAKDIGAAVNASRYSIELVTNYLNKYKFKNWHIHSNGDIVTTEDKKERANEIAAKLCDHAEWKTHSRGITREVAWDICKLKITHSEDVEHLDRAIRRFWAITNFFFERSSIAKSFLSENYSLFKQSN